jgi:hypothetical protein
MTWRLVHRRGYLGQERGAGLEIPALSLDPLAQLGLDRSQQRRNVVGHNVGHLSELHTIVGVCHYISEAVHLVPLDFGMASLELI